GVLQDDGAAGREKGRASVAEPAGAQGNEYVLANAELSTGTADVVLVRLERPGDLLCVLNDPPRFIEVVQRGVARYRRGQLEARTRWKIQDLLKFDILLPVGPPPILDDLVRLPVHDRRPCWSARRWRRAEETGHGRVAHAMPMLAGRRGFRRRCAEQHAVGEIQVEIEWFGIARFPADLRVSRLAVDEHCLLAIVHERQPGSVVAAIDQEIGGAKKILELKIAHSVPAPETVDEPPLSKIEGFEHGNQFSQSRRGIVRQDTSIR